MSNKTVSTEHNDHLCRQSSNVCLNSVAARPGIASGMWVGDDGDSDSSVDSEDLPSLCSEPDSESEVRPGIEVLNRILLLSFLVLRLLDWFGCIPFCYHRCCYQTNSGVGAVASDLASESESDGGDFLSSLRELGFGLRDCWQGLEGDESDDDSSTFHLISNNQPTSTFQLTITAPQTIIRTASNQQRWHQNRDRWHRG